MKNGDLSFESAKVALETIEKKDSFAFEMGANLLAHDPEMKDLYIDAVAGNEPLELLFDYLYDGQEDDFFLG